MKSQAPGTGHQAPGSRTLVIQTAFLGDVVLTTGLLNRLARQEGPVDVVTTRAAAPLLTTHPAVSRVVVFDKKGEHRGLAGLFHMARVLREARYQRAYLPHRSLRTAVLALLARIPARIGFAGSPGSPLYTERVPWPRDTHEADRLLMLADRHPGGPAGGEVRVSLGITSQDRDEAEAWLARNGIGAPFVAIAPGSIWGTKRWPGYAELVQRLTEPVVIVGGPEDRELGAAIASGAPDRVRNAAGELSLRASAALIDRSRLLVTNDSAPLHLASAVGTPIVAIFGPTVPAFGFGPRGPDNHVVEVSGLACRPCSSHGPMVCPLGHHRCMLDLTVDEVLVAVSGER
jgi:heptosyltransferase-2